MKKNPLVELHTYGQSFWLDNINRPLITSGELKRLVEEDGLQSRLKQLLAIIATVDNVLEHIYARANQVVVDGVAESTPVYLLHDHRRQDFAESIMRGHIRYCCLENCRSEL